MNWYYCRDGKVVEGPLEEGVLLAMATAGELPQTAMVAVAGSQEWKSLRQAFPSSLPASPLVSPPPHSPKASEVSHAKKSWFAKLGMLRKVAVVAGGGFVALILLGIAGGGRAGAPASETSPQRSEAAPQVNEEAIFRELDRMTPKNPYPCPICKGSGELANTQPRSPLENQGAYGDSNRCETCYGKGTIRTQSGFETTCPTCSGLGNKKTSPCSKCGGSGQVWGY